MEFESDHNSEQSRDGSPDIGPNSGPAGGSEHIEPNPQADPQTIPIHPETQPADVSSDAGDGMVDMIGQVEQRLAHLRQAHDERIESERVLGERAKEIELREQQLEQERLHIEASRIEIEQSKAEFEQFRSELDDKRKELDTNAEQAEAGITQRQEDLSNLEAHLGERERELNEKAEGFNSSGNDLEAARLEIEHAWAAFNEQKELLSSEQETAQANSERVDQLRADVERRMESIEQEQNALESAREQNERAAIEATKANEAHEIRSTQLEQENDRIREVEEAIRKREVDVSDMEANFEERIARALDALAEAGKEQAALSDAISGLEHRLDTESHRAAEAEIQAIEYEQLASSTQAQIDARATEFETLRTELREAKAAGGNADALEAEVKSLRDRLSQTESDLSSRNAEFQAVSERGGDPAKLEQAVADAEEFKTERDQARAEIQEIQAALGEAQALAVNGERLDQANAEKAELIDELEQLQVQNQAQAEQLSELGDVAEQFQHARAEFDEHREGFEQTIAQLEDQLAQASSGAASAEELAQAQQEVAELRESIEQFQTQAPDEQSAQLAQDLEQYRAAYEQEVETRLDAEAKLTEAQAQLSNGTGQSGGGTSNDPVFVKTRRRRLHAVRGSLSERSRKVRMAGDALQKRFSKCDELMTQRAELVAVRDTLVAAQRRSVKGANVGKTISHVAAVLAIMFTLAATSWVVSLQVMPGLYSANTTIRAEAKGRVPTSEELKEWNDFHSDLLTDPQFVQFAAERFKRRGIESLATIHDLKARMDSELDITSTTPGEIIFELRGRGASRTMRELDTLVTAFLTKSNSLRLQRSDPTTAIVSKQTQVTQDPIDFAHITIAGFVFVGSIVLGVLIGLLAWRKMSTAKVKFERQEEVDAVLDEERWVHPRKAA